MAERGVILTREAARRVAETVRTVEREHVDLTRRRRRRHLVPSRLAYVRPASAKRIIVTGTEPASPPAMWLYKVAGAITRESELVYKFNAPHATGNWFRFILGRSEAVPLNVTRDDDVLESSTARAGLNLVGITEDFDIDTLTHAQYDALSKAAEYAFVVEGEASAQTGETVTMVNVNFGGYPWGLCIAHVNVPVTLYGLGFEWVHSECTFVTGNAKFGAPEYLITPTNEDRDWPGLIIGKPSEG